MDTLSHTASEQFEILRQLVARYWQPLVVLMAGIPVVLNVLKSLGVPVGEWPTVASTPTAFGPVSTAQFRPSCGLHTWSQDYDDDRCERMERRGMLAAWVLHYGERGKQLVDDVGGVHLSGLAAGVMSHKHIQPYRIQ
jgi:hypothetical protein